jgi:hypothetical protein
MPQSYRDGSSTAACTVDASEAAGLRPVEGDQRADVDERDQRRDHDRGQGRLREVLEEPGEEEQGDPPPGGLDEAVVLLTDTTSQTGLH